MKHPALLLLLLTSFVSLLTTPMAHAAKTVFTNGDPATGQRGTVVTAQFLNAVNNHRHDGQNNDGSGILDYYPDTGAANAVAIAPNPALTAHIPGMPLWFRAAATNTGAATITVNSLAAAPLTKQGGTALAPGDIAAGQICQVAWDGTEYQLLAAGLTQGVADTRYLPMSGQAADSARFGGQYPSYYLPATAQAADSAKLGGQPASYYAPASALGSFVSTANFLAGGIAANGSISNTGTGGFTSSATGNVYTIYFSTPFAAAPIAVTTTTTSATTAPITAITNSYMQVTTSDTANGYPNPHAFTFMLFER